ncbi:non-canonical purine NTP pyrophosphatase [Pantoea alhagi]|uniref:non-canonical purine NTP pyrophosphatase n=1 Tax=Pantoea alhagi TaxID=1891675 RepID=UPI00202B1C8F|nr:non-canonical purine NTP pyrophosphatase [Pantoea alhagi]URQ61716.1 non-canonical purine NTP pyrophosphatase [Pantoea alhagi]
MKIRFLSSNELKLDEVRKILEPIGVEVLPVACRIEEIQTEDEVELVHDKLTKAFSLIGRPLFVEHTGLYLDGLNGLPAGLTRIFWHRLDADRFTALVQALDSQSATAKTVLGYCDGRKMYQFSGEVRGKIIAEPAGSREFLWDCIFVPEGHTQTFAEMGELKHEISMRRLALDRFAAFLKTARNLP